MTESQKQKAAFASLLAATCLIGWAPLFKTFELAWSNDEYTYILLILPFSLALFLSEQSVAGLAREWDLREGFYLLGAAAAFGIAALTLSRWLLGGLSLSFEVLAVVLSWVGGFVLCFGREAARRMLFPLSFLVGLVPLPGAAMNYMVALLQVGSAWSAHALFAISGVPVVQKGVMLTIPELTIQVAQECSSIRSSSLLLVTAIISAKFLLRSPWHRILIIALAIPLSVAKNGLRIFTIAMLGTRVDPAYLTGNLHRQGGSLFFLLALVAVFGAIAVVRRREKRQTSWNSQRRTELSALEASVPTNQIH